VVEEVAQAVTNILRESLRLGSMELRRSAMVLLKHSKLSPDEIVEVARFAYFEVYGSNVDSFLLEQGISRISLSHF
jgi:hypothetical protein